jgi:hypothetical protein
MRVGFEWLKRLWLDERFDEQKTALGGGFAFTEGGLNPVAWTAFCSLCQTL